MKHTLNVRLTQLENNRMKATIDNGPGPAEVLIVEGTYAEVREGLDKIIETLQTVRRDLA